MFLRPRPRPRPRPAAHALLDLAAPAPYLLLYLSALLRLILRLSRFLIRLDLASCSYSCGTLRPHSPVNFSLARFSGFLHARPIGNTAPLHSPQPRSKAHRNLEPTRPSAPAPTLSKRFYILYRGLLRDSLYVRQSIASARCRDYLVQQRETNCTKSSIFDSLRPCRHQAFCRAVPRAVAGLTAVQLVLLLALYILSLAV